MGHNKEKMHNITIIACLEVRKMKVMRESYYCIFWSSVNFKRRRGQVERLEYLFKHLKKRRLRQKAD